jgi:toxin ParE1/3/4
VRRLIVSKAARADIRHILETSHQAFGPDARRRYRQLIQQALSDLEASDEPFGSTAARELGSGHRIYRIRFARPSVEGATVRRPRHGVVYRIEAERLIVLRVLHERQLIARNVDPDS